MVTGADTLRERTGSSPDLSFLRQGQGRCLLLLHEIGGSLASWDRIAPGLAERFMVLRYDQRGSGASEKSVRPYAQQELVQDALTVLNAAKVREPVLVIAVAASCVTAVGLANAAPDRIAGLVLCSPSLGMDEVQRQSTVARAEFVRTAGMVGLAETAMERIYPPELRDDYFPTYREQFISNDPDAFVAANLAFAASEAEPEEVWQPALVLAGLRDIRPVEAVRAQAERFPDAEFAVIDGAGHLPHLQNPESVRDRIAEFASRMPG